MKRATPICAVLLVAASAQLRSQHSVLAGPVAGYEFSVPLLLQRNAGAINYDPAVEGSGRSYSHSILLGAQLVAPSTLGSTLGYSGRLALYATSANFTFDPFVPGLDLDTAATTIDPGRYREVAVDLTAASVVADAQLRLRLGADVMAGLGLWGSVRISGQFTRTERPSILPPDIDVEEATIVTGGSRIASHAYSFGALGSLALSTPLSRRVTLMPELTTRLDAVALRKGMGIRSFTLGAGVSLLFDASDAPAVASTGAPVGAIEHDDTTQTPSRLEVRVDLSAAASLDSLQHAALIAEDVVNRLYFAMPRVLPYDANGHVIRGGLIRVSQEDARTYSERNLAGLDVPGHYRHVLNILGLRLRSAPSTKLSVTGIATRDEPNTLGAVRAQSVRKYLIDVWRIDPARIDARSRSGESPSVVLEGSDALFRSPLLSQWRSRRYRMPAVALDHEIVADAGVRTWGLELAHGDRIVARFSSDSGAIDPSLELRFAAGGDDGVIPPIIATMTVEDSTGRIAVARDELMVRKPAQPRATVVGREHLSFVAFADHADSDVQRVRLRATARAAALALRDGASVTIAAIGGVRGRDQATIDVSRIAEDLLATANERGVRIERFTAVGELEVIAGMPDGVRIDIEQSRIGAIDTGDAD